MNNDASTNIRMTPHFGRFSPLPENHNADTLFADYINNDNVESLCTLILDHYAQEFNKIIVSKLHPQTESELNEYLTDFCDFLLTPTIEGHRRLENFQADQSPKNYLKGILRNWTTDLLVARSQKRTSERPIDGDDVLTIADRPEDDIAPYDEMISALLKGIDGCDNLNPRDRYILLTWLMIKSSDADATQLEVCAVLASQLDSSPESVRRALGRALVRLKAESLKIFNSSCPN